MKFLNRLIGGNVLLKVTSLNSLSVIAQMVCGLIISKVIAVFVGPQGMTLIGNLRNFLGAAQQVSILGMYNGIVKYTAEFKDDNLELKKLFSTRFYLAVRPHAQLLISAAKNVYLEQKGLKDTS